MKAEFKIGYIYIQVQTHTMYNPRDIYSTNTKKYYKQTFILAVKMQRLVIGDNWGISGISFNRLVMKGLCAVVIFNLRHEGRRERGREGGKKRGKERRKEGRKEEWKASRTEKVW